MSARLRTMTFNVRYDDPGDGVHAWANRREIAIDVIRRHQPDLLALQEPTPAQWADIRRALPALAPFGRDADDWSDAERPAGLFLTRRFTPAERGVFWLSATPSIPDSESWPHDWGPRACTWIRLHDADEGRDLLFASTHFDTNAAAWLPSARVVHAQLADIAGDTPIVLAGDFNCPAGSDAHRYLCSDAHYHDAWLAAGRSDDGIVTYNAFTDRVRLPDTPQWPYPPEAFGCGNYRIDWILAHGEFAFIDAAIDCSIGDIRPSDHCAVVSTLQWRR